MSGERSTLVGTPVVVAPGKIFLVGEYAVLEQGAAVLAAVNRYAVAQFIPGMDATSRVVSEAVKRATAEIGEAASALPPGSALVNSDDFQQGEQKLGLGSSAAVAVASVGAVFEAAGIPIQGNRERIFNVAYAAHRAAQDGAGSGADVAVACYGGLLKVQKGTGTVPVVDTLTMPPGLHMVIFWTGHSVSTTNMIDGMTKFARKDPAAYHQIIENLKEIADRFIDELRAGNATGAVAAAGRYGRRLGVLGAAASVPIFTEAFNRASDLAKELGGIAKPSGAGGGDVGVAMFATPETARLFARALPKSMTALDLDFEAAGIRRQMPGEEDSNPSGQFHV
jgi:phosphomevalonate kinase